MGLDAGRVLKRSVLCPHCNEDYLFTLRAIAGNPELRCHGCGGNIRLSDRAYEQLLSDVGNALEEINSAPPSFVSARSDPPFSIAVGRLILTGQLRRRSPPQLVLEIQIRQAPAPLWSRATKQAFNSSTVHGGGQRRGGIT